MSKYCEEWFVDDVVEYCPCWLTVGIQQNLSNHSVAEEKHREQEQEEEQILYLRRIEGMYATRQPIQFLMKDKKFKIG